MNHCKELLTERDEKIQLIGKLGDAVREVKVTMIIFAFALTLYMS